MFIRLAFIYYTLDEEIEAEKLRNLFKDIFFKQSNLVLG